MIKSNKLFFWINYRQYYLLTIGGIQPKLDSGKSLTFWAGSRQGIQTDSTAFGTMGNNSEKQDIKELPPLMRSMEILSALWSGSITLIDTGKNSHRKRVLHSFQPFLA